MSKTYILVGVVVAILVAGFGYQSFFITNDGETKEAMAERLMRQGNAMDINKNESTSSMEQETMEGKAMIATRTSMVKDSVISRETMMAKMGSYTPYDTSKLAMAKTGHVVLFFHASWCPTCRSLDADIKTHLKDIPANLTILDVDYDKSSELKKKYGVTYQHTLVEVDVSGTMIKKWSGSPTLTAIINEVK